MNRVVILLLLLAAGAAAYWFWPRTVDNGALLLYGNVDIREVQLGFRVGGRVQGMRVEEGDAVSAGDELAALDATPYREALALTDARVAEAEARLALLNRGSRPQEIDQARARVEEAQAAQKNAEQELQRQRDLTRSGLSSQHLLDSALALRDQARARLAAARDSLALAEEGFRSEDIAAGEAALAATLAQREQANTQLADATLLAPANGVVLTRVREPGSIVAPGVPVYTLSLTDSVYVRAYVSETALGVVAPGTRVQVTTDSSDKIYSGQVGFVSPRAEFTPKSVETAELRTDLVYRLRIVIADSDTGLRQGMPVTVRMNAG